MRDKIAAWLKGNRDYGMGVALYVAYGTDRKLKHALLQGKNPFNEKRLLAELSAMVHEMPVPGPANSQPQAVKFTAVPYRQQSEQNPLPSIRITESSTALIARVQQEAFTAWKELMNKRAMLFALCQTDGWEDENEPGKVAMRGKLALEILEFHDKVVLPAYNRLDHVRATGTLPKEMSAAPTQEEAYSALPDHQVKRTIDNLRKNLGKMRRREPTPERLAMIAEHEANLQKLLRRWDSLK
jgi:hypothetical protein